MDDKEHFICFEQLGYMEIFKVRNNAKVREEHHVTNEWIIDACPTGEKNEYLIAIYERGLEFIQFDYTPESGFKMRDKFQTVYFSYKKIHAIC